MQMIEEEKERKRNQPSEEVLKSQKANQKYLNGVKKQENQIKANNIVNNLARKGNVAKIVASGAKYKLGGIFAKKIEHQKIVNIIAEKEEKANVYGFDRSMLGTPTSNSMLNSFILRNADV